MIFALLLRYDDLWLVRLFALLRLLHKQFLPNLQSQGPKEILTSFKSLNLWWVGGMSRQASKFCQLHMVRLGRYSVKIHLMASRTFISTWAPDFDQEGLDMLKKRIKEPLQIIVKHVILCSFQRCHLLLPLRLGTRCMTKRDADHLWRGTWVCWCSATKGGTGASSLLS